jgi:large subunit ribosomal protein L25
MADTAPNLVAAHARPAKGKGPARRLRQDGLIPAVVYGLGAEATPVAVDPTAVLKAIATPHKRNTLITLQLADGVKQVLFKDYQVDPVSRQLLHADFLEVALDKPVRVRVPVLTTGKAEGVTAGGILSVTAHDVVVEALPNRIPVSIEVDVTPIKMGHSLHVSELKAPAGAKILFSTDYVVAYVAVPEKEEVVAPVAVPGAPAEGAAAAAPGTAPGAAPAAGAPAAAGAAPAKPGDAKAAAPAKGGDAKGGGKK